MAAETPTSAEAAEELLALIDPVRDEVDALTAEIDPLAARRAEAYERRAAVFLRIREEAPDLAYAKLAERAGVSVPAVIQQVDKALYARATASGDFTGTFPEWKAERAAVKAGQAS